MSVSPEPPSSTDQPSKPFYTRWWFIVLAVLIALVVLGSIVGDDASDTTEGAALATTTSVFPTTTQAPTTTAAPTTTTEAPTTTAAPTTTTEAPTTTAAPTLSFSGSGDDVIEVTVPGDAFGALKMTHAGSSNFIVTALSASGERIDGLVNVIGSYEGTVPVNVFDDEPSLALLEISADGQWTVEVLQIPSIPTASLTDVTSQGDQVFRIEPPVPSTATPIDVTHNGESNFVVRILGDNGIDLVVNEIGPYAGTVLAPAEPLLLVVNADGDWTIST